MDPVTVIGLLSNIAGFIDLGWNLFKDARGVYKSASGLTESALAHKLMAEKMEQFSNNLIASHTTTSKEDKAIVDLACNCRELAQEISHLLRKTTPQDPKSFFHAAGSSFKAVVFYGPKRKELQGRLTLYRQQLHWHSTKATSSEIKSSLKRLIDTSESNDKRMAQLQGQVKLLRQMMDKLSSPDAGPQLRELLNISENAYYAILSQKVLKTLRFGDMNTRFDSVPQALEDTYQWIFDNELNTNEKYEHRHQLGQSLSTWLASGNGIFHIAGKLGSGKSTLMKLLCQDDRTKERLKEWACDNELIKWEEIKSSPPQEPEDDFSLKDLQDAFDHVRGIEGYRICFFLDGLDEYEKTPDAGYVDLAARLYQWTQEGSNMKLCVSSRQDNPFINRFLEEQRIYMQDLNELDIRRFIDDKLVFEQPLDKDQHRELDSLKTSIFEKSAGVFLWVTLVIAQLHELDQDREGIEMMKKEIDNIPTEIENAFKNILESIRYDRRRRAFRTFATIQKWNEYKVVVNTDLCLPLGAFYFMDDCSSDLPDEHIIPTLIEKWKQASEDNRPNEACKIVMGSCKGLIEPIKYTKRTFLIMEMYSNTICGQLTSRIVLSQSFYGPTNRQSEKNA